MIILIATSRDANSKSIAPDTGSKWLVRAYKNSFAPFQLFCFSYAGGGASIFSDWGFHLKDFMEVLAVQLPGRESRFSEKLLSNIDDVVEQAALHINRVADRTFLLFGHSLGALIAYEVALRLSDQYSRCPKQLIVSGKQSLDSPPRRKKIFDLPDASFIEELRKYNGTPELILQNEELRSLILPILRADITMFDCYKPGPKSRLDCPVTAFGGTDDPYVYPEDLQGWKDTTNSTFNYHVFSGDHFFITGEGRSPVLETIKFIASNLR
jgi:medium-chain acyl-[acyl-carrier-protein] hydrolase